MLSVIEKTEPCDFSVIEMDKKPKTILMNNIEFGVTAIDISDYVYLDFVDGKAIYSEIGANLLIR